MPLEAFLNTCELIGADPRAIMDAAYERLTKEMGQPEDLSSAAVDAADAALADADNGIDIDAWADRIKAEDSVCEEE